MRMYPAALGAALALGMAGAAFGGITPSDLRCHKIKDPLAKQVYAGTLDSVNAQFPDESCAIKTPAKLLCTPVVTQIVLAPTASGGVVIPSLNEQLACYKVKCAKSTFTVQMSDRFGARTMTVKAPKMVCAPANFTQLGLAEVSR